MALSRAGQAVFFTRKGKMIASAPPTRVTKERLPESLPEPLPEPLPPPPPLPPGELSNGAAAVRGRGDSLGAGGRREGSGGGGAGGWGREW